MTPKGSNPIRKEMHFFILTPAGSHIHAGTNADVQRRGATPLGLGYVFCRVANYIEPRWGSEGVLQVSNSLPKFRNKGNTEARG